MLCNDKKITCNPLNKEIDKKNDWSAGCTLWSCLPSWLPETSFPLKRWIKWIILPCGRLEEKKEIEQKRDEPMGGAL